MADKHSGGGSSSNGGDKPAVVIKTENRTITIGEINGGNYTFGPNEPITRK